MERNMGKWIKVIGMVGVLAGLVGTQGCGSSGQTMGPTISAPAQQALAARDPILLPANVAPTSMITQPVNGQIFSSLLITFWNGLDLIAPTVIISGSALDSPDSGGLVHPGIANVKMSIRRIESNHPNVGWDGSRWRLSDQEIWFSPDFTGGAGACQATFGEVLKFDGSLWPSYVVPYGKFLIRVRATDLDGKEEAPGSAVTISYRDNW